MVDLIIFCSRMNEGFKFLLVTKLNSMFRKPGGTNFFFPSLLQLILATIPRDGQAVGPSIVSDENILLMFEIQEKVRMRMSACLGYLLVFYPSSNLLVSSS